ncbi:glutathione S-transferase kappa1-like protein [Leptotrombidium deliense]|uniref:Glutathione S-transferase kappa n=1 Tax=Leptotrombidium deliense TaxID=299467 RepID=A0A443SPG2_9ACAR|nr:glutathione S-transferase kappa1-like protein [Leptotrombidium deliense]
MSKGKVIVDLFFDVCSPYAWFAFELLTRHRNVWRNTELKLKPFLVHEVYKKSNNTQIPCADKMKYIANDCKMLSAYYNIPMQMTSNYSLLPNTTKAMTFLTAVEETNDYEALEKSTRELFYRIYGNDPPLDVTSDSAFIEICNKCGINSLLIESIEKESTKDRLNKYTNDAVCYGAFGTPTMVAHLSDGPKLLFGSDRVELLSHLLNETYCGPLLKFNSF